ncbi:hypothetical protein ZWY2020_033097 [Hordeum vulgare]|nr:hypothetical protein ZWY2020_033097 [Hordeum vulgare]
MAKRGNAMEKFVKDFLAKMVMTLMEFYPDFEKETFEVGLYLDPVKTHVRDALAVDMYRLNCRLLKVQGYIARLRATVGRIDKELCPEDTFQVDLEAVMGRLVRFLIGSKHGRSQPCGVELMSPSHSSDSIARRREKIS